MIPLRILEVFSTITISTKYDWVDQYTASFSSNCAVLQAFAIKLKLKAVMKNHCDESRQKKKTQNFQSSTKQHFLQFCSSCLHSQQCHEMINDSNLRSATTAHSQRRAPQWNTVQLDDLAQRFTSDPFSTEVVIKHTACQRLMWTLLMGL